MAIQLIKGEPVGTPPVGSQWLATDSTGTPYLLNSDGSRSPVGGGSSLPGAVVTALIDSDTLDCTGLNGDTDGDYWFGGEVTFPAAGGSVYDLVAEPNNLTTNQTSVRFFNSAGAVTAESNANDLRLGSCTGGSPVTFKFEAFLYASKTGQNRLWRYNTFRGDLLVHSGTGQWLSTAGPITTVRFNCRSGGAGQTAKFLTGSRVRWAALGRPQP